MYSDASLVCVCVCVCMPVCAVCGVCVCVCMCVSVCVYACVCVCVCVCTWLWCFFLSNAKQRCIQCVYSSKCGLWGVIFQGDLGMRFLHSINFLRTGCQPWPPLRPSPPPLTPLTPLLPIPTLTPCPTGQVGLQDSIHLHTWKKSAFLHKFGAYQTTKSFGVVIVALVWNWLGEIRKTTCTFPADASPKNANPRIRNSSAQRQNVGGGERLLQQLRTMRGAKIMGSSRKINSGTLILIKPNKLLVIKRRLKPEIVLL